jgi:hypothetical protein
VLFKPGDALVPGEYHVTIECWRQPPSDFTPGISFAQGDYRPPDLDVKPDASGPVEYKADVPIAR